MLLLHQEAQNFPVPGARRVIRRSTQGVRVMNVAEKDRVTAVAISNRGKKKRAKAGEADSNDGTLTEADIDETEE